MYDSKQHTVEAIAKVVGVSRATLYRHLESSTATAGLNGVMSQLDTVRQIVGGKVAALADAYTPGAAFTALLQLERAAAKARVLAVHLVLDDGRKYRHGGGDCAVVGAQAMRRRANVPPFTET